MNKLFKHPIEKEYVKELEIEVSTLKDKLRRRNAQIKDLKAKLYETTHCFECGKVIHPHCEECNNSIA